MKIQREVNGQVLEFELTFDELVSASEELEQLHLLGDEARENAGEKRTEKEPFVKSVRDAVAHCCRELNRDEEWEPARKESDFKAIFESEKFFGLYYYFGDNEYYLVEKESGAYNLVLGDSPDFVGRNFLKVLEGDTVLKVYDRNLLECLVNGVNENVRGFVPDEEIVGIPVLEKALEMVWVTVYKDVLGINDEKDNLTEISVPKMWLKESLKEQDVEDLEGWLDVYTADWTVDIARMAMDGCLIENCVDPNFGVGGIVDYHGHLCEVVSMKDGRAYLQDVNNDTHFEPTLEHFFRNAERVEAKDISKSALDCVGSNNNKEDLLRAALDFYEYDVQASIQDPYFMKHADAFIYGHQEGVSDIDLDFWVQYEELLGEKITYDEYRFVDGLYDGDPLELLDTGLSVEEKYVFAEIKGKLAERRAEKNKSLNDTIADVQSRKAAIKNCGVRSLDEPSL